MKRLTQDKLKCSHCSEERQLVIRRRRAYLCETCDNEMLAERKALRELNRIAREIIGA